MLADWLAIVALGATFQPGARLSVVADPCHLGSLVWARESTEVSVTPVYSAADLQKLPGARTIDMLSTIRPGFTTTPMKLRGLMVGYDSERTAIGLDALNKVEILKGPIGADWGRQANAGVIQLITKIKRGSTFDDCEEPNIRLVDDGWTKVQYAVRYMDVLGDVEVKRVTQLAEHPEPRVDLLAQTRIYVGTILQPQTPKITFVADNGTYGGNPNNYLNSIGGIQFTPEYAQKIGLQGLWFPKPSFDMKVGYNWAEPRTANTETYLADSFRTFGEVRVKDWISRTGLDFAQVGNMMRGSAAQGSSMNRLTFPGDPSGLGDARCGSGVTLPGGTVWYPDKVGYQAMTNTTKLRYQYSFSAGVDGALLQQDMETHCLNIALKEPAAGVRYFPYSSPDPMINELAKITENSMLRGPWDQARTWIYTDKASIDEVNQRLLPRIGPSQYVNGLWDVVSRGGLSRNDLRNPKFFMPKLLVASGAREDAFRWFATHACDRFSASVADWIDSRPADLESLFTADAKDFDKRHTSRLAKAVLSASMSKPRIAMLRFLDSQPTVPAGIGDLRTSLYSFSNEEISLALKLCAKSPSIRPMEALRYLADQGANDTIKNAAKDLL